MGVPEGRKRNGQKAYSKKEYLKTFQTWKYGNLDPQDPNDTK